MSGRIASTGSVEVCVTTSIGTSLAVERQWRLKEQNRHDEGQEHGEACEVEPEAHVSARADAVGDMQVGGVLRLDEPGFKDQRARSGGRDGNGGAGFSGGNQRQGLQPRLAAMEALSARVVCG